jgi:hypothetical protein
MNTLLPSFIDKEFEILEIREDTNEEGYSVPERNSRI